MGFFSGGKQTSETNTYSGLRHPNLWNEFSDTAKGVANDYSFLSNAGRNYFNSPMPTLNPQGFYDQQMEGVNQFGKQMFGNVSGDYASRGFLTPDNIGGVIGSAVTAASPQLMSQIASNIQQQEAMKTNRFSPLLSVLGAAPGLLGNEGHTTATYTAPGIGYTFGSGVASSLGEGLGGSLSKGISGLVGKYSPL